jgi:hypothetical protein
MPFDLGDVVPLTVEVRDAIGALANAGAIALTITKPDGLTDTPIPTNPSTGRYQSDYTPLTAGRYLVRWVATGANASAYTDAFDVRESAPPLLISLADAKSILNVSTTTNDSKLRDLIESTTSDLELMVGPVVRRSVSERYEAFGTDALVLRSAPAISVTSIVRIHTGGPTYDVAQVDLDTETGIIQNRNGRGFLGPLRITYVAGRTVVPAGIRDGARIMLKNLWNIQNGTVGLPRLTDGSDPGMVIIPGLGYPLPKLALELLQPFLRLGKFA